MVKAQEDVHRLPGLARPDLKGALEQHLLELANEEIKRYTRVAGISPNDKAITRLVGRY
jgi:putative transposase